MSVKPRPCQRCGTEIPAERLDVMPETRLCIACSKTAGGEFDIAITAENLAKAGSMEKNYGSFDVKKTRRPIRKQEKDQ